MSEVGTDRPATGTARSSRRPSMTTMLVIGLVLGLVWGLFFGESGSWIGWIGEAFIGLLQMTVLPYVALSLVCNIGRLSPNQGGQLARVTCGVMALLWAIGLLVVVALSFSFPNWEGGSFFSSGLVEESSVPDWIDMFIPSNLFRSLTQNLVPAVVLFSIGLGVALISIPGKQPLLGPIDVLVEALGRLNRLIFHLSPLGIFAIVGEASGKISVEQFELLQGYILVYVSAALFMSLWVLPALISCCTPFSHRQVLAATRDVMIAAFIIGNTFVVLPMIIESIKRLMLRTQRELNEPLQTPEYPVQTPEYSVQLAYAFPDIGRMVVLVFIPFAAWFYGSRIDPTTGLQLVATGFIGAFAKPVITIPLLLDIAEIPADIFNLFLAISVFTSRFGDLMKVMHLVAFAILTASCLTGTLKLAPFRLLTKGIFTVVVFGIMIVSTRTYLNYSFQDSHERSDLVATRSLLGEPVDAVLLERAEPNPIPLAADEDRMERILRRGVIRVGVDLDELPFSYMNRAQQLVGYDVDMAHQMARDLGVTIEFVPFNGDLIESLKADHFDVAMSGLEGTVERATSIPEMEPYMEVTRAFVVRDYIRRDFRTLEYLAQRLEKTRPLRVAFIVDSIQSENQNKDFSLGSGSSVVNRSGLLDRIEIVQIRNESEFFESDPPIADVLATSAEEGSAWTLEYPEYSVVKPTDWYAQTPLHYYVAEESQFRDFVNSWLQLKRHDGTTAQLYDYWILGKSTEPLPPRWCILRDVLHWIR